MKPKNRAGALRATNNKGLQPAMDFILEHNEDPIPDATSAAAETSSAQPIDVDEDEDTAALRAVYGTGRGAEAQAAYDASIQAKVRS